MKFPIARLLAALVICTLAGCTTNSAVKVRDPKFRVTSTMAPLSEAEAQIVKGQRNERFNALGALGNYISAAQIALKQLQSHPKDALAEQDYNFAVGRILEVIRKSKLEPWSHPLKVPASNGGEFILSHKPDPRPQWNPALYTFTPADQFDVHGAFVEKRTTRPGIGAPLVAVGREINKDARANFTPPRMYYGVTAVAHFEGNRCILSLEDPLAAETVRVDGHTYALAADFTVPIAVMLAENDMKKYELPRMLNPEKYAHTAQIVRLQPYDPNKTVVLVIHGLMDTQATWTPMINTLRGDPEIRKKYQFWFYSYPSGYPYPYSAAILRHELDVVEKKFHITRPIVVIGHSMGGCITRLLITDSNGDGLWMKLFKKKPVQTPLSQKSREILTESLIFKRHKEIGRVIFISSPLLGSDIATSWVGRIGSSIVRSPVTLLKAGDEILKATTFQSGELKLKRVPNSIDTLSPNNRFVKIINTFPITPGIPYHTIIGDCGKGDSPNSSDGVVPYWSSHMDGAVSECIVPSSHSAHRNEKAIREVRRILLLPGN
ncbi:MAG: hypothetical protein ABIP97_06245 [Chthoniobacterales bacterium]